MTTNVTATVINESAAKIIVQYLIQSDGQDGELSNFLILDPPNGFTPPLSGAQLRYPFLQCTILQVWHQASTFDMIISFNAEQPVPIVVLPKACDNYQDFRYFGGLKDRTTQDADGKVLLSTTGLDGALSSVGTLVIEFKKD